MDWEKLFLLLLGSGISIVTSIVMFKLSQGKDKEKREEERRRQGAADALDTLNEITNSVNLFASVSKSISECVQEADGAGNESFDVGVKVKPLIGIPAASVSVPTRHFSFLLKKRNSQLFSRVIRHFSATQSEIESLNVFNRMRRKYQDATEQLVLGGAEFKMNSDGMSGSMLLEGNVGLVHNAKVGELNNLIEEIIDDLKLRVMEGKEIATLFQAEARQEFGDYFLANLVFEDDE